MARLKVSNHELYYEEAGNGSPVLLIHGSGCSAETWQGVLPSLAKSARVIAYDRRGYHRSSDPPPSKKGYFRAHAEDASELLKGLKVAPATVVGWSGGGLTALHLAVAYPALVRQLVLVEPPFHLKKHMTPEILKTALGMKFFQLIGKGRLSARRFYRFATQYVTGGCSFDQFPAETQKLMLDMAPITNLEFDAGTAEEISTESLASIRCPVTCMVGELSPPRFILATERIMKAIPQAKLVKILNASHAIHFDQPDAFSTVITKTLT